jgi:hypothetical protein
MFYVVEDINGDMFVLGDLLYGKYVIESSPAFKLLKITESISEALLFIESMVEVEKILNTVL